jgi:hypothetical protein
MFGIPSPHREIPDGVSPIPASGAGRRRRISCSMNTEASSDPAVHCQNIQRQLEDLIQHLREDINRVGEPRFQALLETSAEVATGLKTAFEHYGRKEERAWGGTGSNR